MVKMDNISNSLMSNPLTHIVIVLFVLVIILGIIRIFSPSFSLGAKVGGHFGSLSGSVNVEGFQDPHESFKMPPGTEMPNEENESFMSEDMNGSITEQMGGDMESFRNY